MEPHTWEPEDEDDYEAANAELKRRFAAWADDKGLEVERDGPEGLLHLANPEDMQWSTRILMLVDSISAFDGSLSMTASMPAMFS